MINNYIFDEYDHNDSITWTAMIQAYSIHGQSKEALILFNKMKNEKIRMSGKTLVCILNACSHNGLVDEAWEIYNNIINNNYNVLPQHQHHACMVDVWARYDPFSYFLYLIFFLLSFHLLSSFFLSFFFIVPFFFSSYFFL